jgi:aspartyl-tRNA synthetase
MRRARLPAAVRPPSPTGPRPRAASRAPTAGRRASTALRTRMAGSLRIDRVGQVDTLTGWVHRRRDLGGCSSSTSGTGAGSSRSRSGRTGPPRRRSSGAADLGAEDVIQVEGEIALRPGDARNPDMATGEVELRAHASRLLNAARTPEIPVFRGPEDELPSEARLRTVTWTSGAPSCSENLVLRHRARAGGAELPRRPWASSRSRPRS